MKNLSFIFCVVSLMCITSNTYGQTSDITNESIRYQVLLVMPDDSNAEFMPSTYYVDVRFPDSIILSKIKRFAKDDWLSLLNDEKSDWAANLLLYSLYKKDAARFTVIKTRNDWVMNRRKEDIAYWEKKLK